MAYADIILADSPRAYYRMNESSGMPQDISGNGNHMTASVGTPTYEQHGMIAADSSSRSILLQGVESEEFNAPDHSSLDVGDSFTFEAWIRRLETGTGERAIVSKGFDGTDGAGGMYILSNQLMVAKAGTNVLRFSDKTIGDTLPHHVAVTKDGNDVHLYIDGQPSDGTVQSEHTTTNNTQVLSIGCEHATTPGSHFAGQISEVALYDTALSAARILAHYEAAFETGFAIPNIAMPARAGGRW